MGADVAVGSGVSVGGEGTDGVRVSVAEDPGTGARIDVGGGVAIEVGVGV